MSLSDTNQLLDALRSTRLLDDTRIQELRTRPEVIWSNFDGLTKHLVESALLTPYQLQEVLAERGDRLVVGGYRIFEPLASYGGGEAFKALHPALQQPVNLRFVHPDWLAPADNVSDYVVRTQEACLVSNPYLANVLDAGVHEGVPFVVQEYVDGCDMLRLVKELGSLPIPLACEYIRQATIALKEASTKNVIHGSVNPRTMLLTPVKRAIGSDGVESVRPRATSTVKLLDLGVAPRRLPLNQFLANDPDPHGRIEFTPPEDVFHDSPTTAGDVYGLGATLYFLLANRPPVVGSNAADVVQQLQQTTPTSIEYLRNDVPPAVGALLSRMLQREPTQRPTFAEVIDTLQPHCEIIAPPAPLAVAVASETTSVPNIPDAMFAAEAAHVAVASETGSIPNVPSAMFATEANAPFSEPLPDAPPLPEVQPLPSDHGEHGFPMPEVQPLDDHHDESFGHNALGADVPAAPRPRKPVTKKNRAWIIAGLCLHCIATLILLSFIGCLPNPFAPSPPTEPKQEDPKTKPKPKQKPKSS